MSCGVGRRGGSDPALLWLRCRPAATAPIKPLAWDPPYAMGEALKRKKKKKKKKPFIYSFSHSRNPHCQLPRSLTFHRDQCIIWRVALPSESYTCTEIMVSPHFLRVHFLNTTRIYIFFFLPFLGPHPWHMEVPRLGI